MALKPLTTKTALRRLLRVAVAGTLYYSGLFTLWRFFRRRILRRKEVCVLGLHRVLSENEHSRSYSLDSIVLRDTTFIEMLEFLERNFRMVSLDGFLRGNGGDKGQSKPLCLLSFDDGWRDNYTTAYPWLKKFKMPATVFLVTGQVDSGAAPWVERLKKAWQDPSRRERIESQLAGIMQGPGQGVDLEKVIEYLKHMSADERQRNLARLSLGEEHARCIDDVDAMMSWDQVVEMSQNGIDFGGHTVSHPLLVYEDDAVVKRELRICRETLERKLGKGVRAFAYPNGDWDKRVCQRVMEAGYECAFTTRRGWYHQGQDPFTIRRILLHEGNVTRRSGKFSPAIFSLTLARGN